MKQEYNDMPKIVKRNGEVVPFDVNKISVAIGLAYDSISGLVTESYTSMIDKLVKTATQFSISERTTTVEDVQDLVQRLLQASDYKELARVYGAYRNSHAISRDEAHAVAFLGLVGDFGLIANRIITVCAGKCTVVDYDDVIVMAGKVACTMPDEQDLNTRLISFIDLLIITARMQIQYEPEYSQLCADLVIFKIKIENVQAIYGRPINYRKDMINTEDSTDIFMDSLEFGIKHGTLSEYVIRSHDEHIVDLNEIVQQELFGKRVYTLLGVQTLFDRYLLHDCDVHYESVPGMFMRVAMGLAHMEAPEERYIRTVEFFDVMINSLYMPSTPTLFNSGTSRPQLSSCYLSTVPDDLGDIFSSIRDNALLSKYAGGLGNDWTSVRGMGAHIKGTNGESQGIVPFLKVANDTAVAVNQGGKRKGAVCAYLETWHIDVEEFLDLRKNTGDDRRRTHDMNIANWIPDLFMERVINGGDWTLFSPDETPDLHDLYGAPFKTAYEAYEQSAIDGDIVLFKTVKAVDLWRKMITRLYETGHPWITFKDAFNVRYTNQHEGVIHSSNLCTEIGLHTNKDEIAVCNLGSINLPEMMIGDGTIDTILLHGVIRTAMRMLDNVIDYNHYAVDKARNSNSKHRPVGLGVLGFQDVLYNLNIPYSSDEAVDLADYIQEHISFYAIHESVNLARERGAYSTFNGSLWSKGILPLDSLKLYEEQRGVTSDHGGSSIPADMWDELRAEVIEFGMRNSNVMAIAPTATISNICGVSQSIEPTYQNIYVKSNLSGEFVVVNEHLVDDLKSLNLWDEAMAKLIIANDGSIQEIASIPANIKEIYKTAFEVDPLYIIKAGARRQKWIDQAQSLNLYVSNPTGKFLDYLYKNAWLHSLKSTYYLRSLSATSNEKTTDGVSCSITDPTCEACQ